ncbi:MAG: hypothetical protein ACYTGZ_20235 [Planctomycetota bacterium]|jgi:hypothetical protein
MADRRTDDQIRFLMGLGLDRDPDGHAHITKGEDFLLLGGSGGTHEAMQEHVERFNHSLRKMGTSFQHATEAEMREAMDRAGIRDR